MNDAPPPTGMNQDRNDIALNQAPASVDNQKVLGVVQVSISDNPAEDSYKVLLANAETAVVPVAQFQAGAEVTTAVEAQPVQAVETPAVVPDPNVAQLPEQPAIQAVDTTPATDPTQINGVSQ